MPWISVDERMPEAGVEVFVHGAYTLDDQLKPKARVVDPNSYKAKFISAWESVEWRGQVAITHWWEEEARLFSYVAATGIGYCDRNRKEGSDYKKIAHLFFSTLELKVYDPTSELLAEIRKDAAKIQARKGEKYQVSTSGQYVTLGFGL